MKSITRPRTKDRTWFLVLVALALLLHGAASPGLAIDLGDTRESIEARHGKPQREDADGMLAYEWGDWLLGVKFVDHKADRIVYGKTSLLTEQDIAGVFIASGGMDAWQKVDEKHWRRIDGTAVASLGKPEGHLLIIEKAQPHPPISPLATVPSISSSRPLHLPPGIIALVWSIVGLGGVMLAAKVFLGKKVAQCPPQIVPDFRQPGSIYVHPPVICTPPPATIDSVPWDQFELVVAEMYRRQGYTVEISSGLGADGGVDIKLERNGEVTLVQCKQWKSWKVGVKNIREFYGTLVHEQAQHGIFVSTKEYTRDCRAFAEGKPILLLDRADILAMAQKAQRPGENIWNVEHWVAEFESSCHVTTPLCPFCDNVMVLRKATSSSPFWGCPSYPHCRGKREVRRDLVKLMNYQQP